MLEELRSVDDGEPAKRVCYRGDEALKRRVIAASLYCFFFSSICIFISSTECITLSPVYWNISNSIFKSSKNDHIIFVNPFDEIDFVCPYYSSFQTTSTAAAAAAAAEETNDSALSPTTESYLIYQVSKSEYDECSILSENSSRPIISCTHPKHRRRFTIWFDPFQSVPNVPEYKAGQSYYFITPSTGHKSGLHNLYQGACFYHNMKLTIRIRDYYRDEEELEDEEEERDISQRSDHIEVFHEADDRLLEAEDNDDDDDDEEDLTAHHSRRRHQHQQPHQHQQQHPVGHRNSRPSSSSSSSSSSYVSGRRKLSRHFPINGSASLSLAGSLPLQTTSGLLYDRKKPTTKNMVPVKGINADQHQTLRHQQQQQQQPIPVHQTDKSASVNPKNSGLQSANSRAGSIISRTYSSSSSSSNSNIIPMRWCFIEFYLSSVIVSVVTKAVMHALVNRSTVEINY